MIKFHKSVAITLAILLSLAVFAYGDSLASSSMASAQDIGDDSLTKAYVDSAIEYYADKGLGKTVTRYGNPLSWEGERYLIIADAHTHVLVSSPLLYLNGRDIESLVPGGQLGEEIVSATESGHWFDAQALNMLTGKQEPARYFIAVEDGLAFMSARFSGDLNTPIPDPPVAEPDDSPVAEPDDDALTLAYVQNAIDRYERDGLDAAVAYYNSEESIEDERRLRIYDTNSRTLLASGENPLERGLDLSSPIGPIAQLATLLRAVTEEGRWIDVVGHDPRTLQDVPKRVFAVRHDGLVFSSGHSVLRENVAEATIDYVERAMALYDQEGLDATVAYYNSQQSLEGNFYLFLIGADDIYVAHPIFPHLIGTDIKDVVGSDGQELGKEIAGATEEGIWVEYLWPHPITRVEEQKTTWAIRHDGLIFASGYYPEIDDPEAYTKDYVQKAIEYYDREGLEATVAYYNSEESVDGQWYLNLVRGDDGIGLTNPVLRVTIGRDIREFKGRIAGEPIGDLMYDATEEGYWIQYLFPHSNTSETLTRYIWAIRHDGLIFTSGYFDDE